jgi:V/A-type H+-transporting ATPase subunit E
MTQMIGSLDDLASAVHRRAGGQAEERLRQAREQASKIIDDAKERAATISQQIVADAQRKAGETRRQCMAKARSKAREKRLQAREELLRHVWQRAEQRLRDLVGTQEYAETLRQLARLGVDTLGAGHLILAADPRGHRLLEPDRLSQWSQAAADEFGAAVIFEQGPEPLDTWGGLVVTAKGGKEQMNATFAFRLQEARGELRDHVFQVLTGAS